MKILFLILFHFFHQYCTGQMLGEPHSFKEVGWTITIPSEFKKIDSAVLTENIKAAVDMVKKEINGPIDLSRSKSLFRVSKNKFNFFSASITDSPSMTDDNWQLIDSLTKQVILKVAISQLPPVQVEINNSIRKIGCLEFKTLNMEWKFNEKISYHILCLTRFYKNFYFLITYAFKDSPDQEEIEEMLLNSKFK